MDSIKGIHWTLTLKCPTCGAHVTWVDERPDWQQEPEDTEAIEKAEAWVAEHPLVTRDNWLVGTPKEQLPKLVSYNILTGITYVVYPERPRYVSCPACEGVMTIDDWAPADTPLVLK